MEFSTSSESLLTLVTEETRPWGSRVSPGRVITVEATRQGCPEVAELLFQGCVAWQEAALGMFSSYMGFPFGAKLSAFHNHETKLLIEQRVYHLISCLIIS